MAESRPKKGMALSRFIQKNAKDRQDAPSAPPLNSFATPTVWASPFRYSSYMTEQSDVTEALPSDGNYRLCLIGKDSFENEQPYAMATVLNWELDTVAPSVSFSSATSASYINSLNKTAFSVSVSCSDANQMVKFMAVDKNDLELSGIESCSSSNLAAYTFNTSTLADGPVSFFVVHKDAAGNTTPTTLILGVSKDTIAPTFADPTPVDADYYSSLSLSPPLAWAAATDTSGSGVTGFHIGFGTNSRGMGWWPWPGRFGSVAQVVRAHA